MKHGNSKQGASACILCLSSLTTLLQQTTFGYALSWTICIVLHTMSLVLIIDIDSPILKRTFLLLPGNYEGQEMKVAHPKQLFTFSEYS